MTPKTLRKERIQKFVTIICDSMVGRMAATYSIGRMDEGEWDREVLKLAAALADAAQSRTEILGIQAAIFADRPVTEADLPVGEEALQAFERDMQCPSSWSWYPAKSSDEPAWKALREFVIKTYQSDKDAFTKYHTWAAQPYSRGAKTVGQIRQDPTCFEFAFADYLTANPVVASTNREEGKSSGYFA